MKTDNRRFYAIITVLAVIIVALLFLLLWRNRTQHDSNDAPSTTASNTDVKDSKTAFTVDAGKLPKNWVIEASDANDIILKNDITKCFTDVLYTNNVPESDTPADRDYKQTVATYRSQDYTLTESTGTLTVVTVQGNKQIESRQVALSGKTNPAFKEFAYMVQPTSYVHMTLSCPSRSDIISAEQALKAVTLYKY